MTLARSLRALSFWVALGLALATGAIGGALTQLGPWYRALAKPDFQPPDWLFGPVWTLIFVLAAYAAHQLWVGAAGRARTLVIVVFAVNIAMNLGWSYLFFYSQRPDLAVYAAIALWLSVFAIIAIVGRYAPVSRWLLTPYLAWVAFAFVLNIAIVRLNPTVALA